jgi:hypothetical protein
MGTYDLSSLHQLSPRDPRGMLALPQEMRALPQDLRDPCDALARTRRAREVPLGSRDGGVPPP